MRIHSSLVLITGASSGIGAATALEVARRGGRVVLLARSRGGLEAVADKVRAAGSTAHVYPVDLADPEAVEATARRIEEEVGVPDVLVNNAGAGRWLYPEETEPRQVMAMMAVPYFAAFWLTRAFLPAMRRRGSGHIVNVTSAAAYVGMRGATGYSAARWAVRGFTAALRSDLAGSGIGVTLIAPGKVATPYFEHNPGSEERIPAITRLYPTLTVEQVARSVVRAVERRRREVVEPFLLRLTLVLHRIVPWPVDWLLVRTGWRRPPA
jgi:short-subunit dehydrogenase